ncbi:MAG: hypothetical protein Q8918_16025 [Bacteroidota bacterium]|nr:hypothetical protein [Bacteroidota bacterium]
MKNETKENFESTVRLTRKTLQHLIDKGFQYVQVRGFTLDKRPDYMEPHYLILLPMKELPEDPAKKDIYEPIHSSILTGWANFPNDGVEVFIAMAASRKQGLL